MRLNIRVWLSGHEPSKPDYLFRLDGTYRKTPRVDPAAQNQPLREAADLGVDVTGLSAQGVPNSRSPILYAHR